MAGHNPAPLPACPSQLIACGCVRVFKASSAMADDACSSKWRCDHCTYDNWTSAVRCTMCRTARAPKVIEEKAALSGFGMGIGHVQPRNSSSTDIYSLTSDPGGASWQQQQQQQQKLCDSPTPSSSSSLTSSATAVSASAKWSCPMCTYLNWPRAHKCVQCYTVRKRVSPSSMSPRSSTPASTTAAVTPGMVAPASSSPSPSSSACSTTGQSAPQTALTTSPTANFQLPSPSALSNAFDQVRITSTQVRKWHRSSSYSLIRLPFPLRRIPITRRIGPVPRPRSASVPQTPCP